MATPAGMRGKQNERAFTRPVIPRCRTLVNVAPRLKEKNLRKVKEWKGKRRTVGDAGLPRFPLCRILLQVSNSAPNFQHKKYPPPPETPPKFGASSGGGYFRELGVEGNA